MLDELRCIYCGMCEEACPVDAIELTHIYDLTGETREELILDKEKLLAIYDETQRQPQGPGAHRARSAGPGVGVRRTADAGAGDGGAAATTARPSRPRPA